jgi:hypothetical protein
MRRSRLPAQESAPDITATAIFHALALPSNPSVRRFFILAPSALLYSASCASSFVAARRLSPVIAFQHATIRTRTHLPVAD